MGLLSFMGHCLSLRPEAIIIAYLTDANGKTTKLSSERCLHVIILASASKPQLMYWRPVRSTRLLDAISTQVTRLLKEQRRKRRLSLNVLAQKAGVARQTVSYVEQEVRNPTLDTLLRITTALEVDLEQIIAKARKRAH